MKQALGGKYSNRSHRYSALCHMGIRESQGWSSVEEILEILNFIHLRNLCLEDSHTEHPESDLFFSELFHRSNSGSRALL